MQNNANKIEEYLNVIAKCYIKKDFKDMYSLFAKDVIWESNWVTLPREGYDVVTKYYDDKAKSLKESRWDTFHCLVMTLDPFDNPNKNKLRDRNGSTVMLYHEIGKIMDYVVQIDDNGEVSDMIIDIKLNKEEKISRIDICIPTLFHFEKYKEINRPFIDTVGNLKAPKFKYFDF